MYFMSMVAQQAEGIFGVKLPIADPKPRAGGEATVSASIAVSFSFGLKQVFVGMGGAWTIGSLVANLGLA